MSQVMKSASIQAEASFAQRIPLAFNNAIQDLVHGAQYPESFIVYEYLKIAEASDAPAASRTRN